MIRFETTLGNFTVKLFEKEAPVTVANFLAYIDDGFFDGTIFHRVIPGFVIQGGGFTADMSQNLVALDASTGEVLWHMYPGGSFGTGPMTYELDGRQYVVFLDDSVAYAFALPATATPSAAALRSY